MENTFLLASGGIQLIALIWFITDPRPIGVRLQFALGKSFHSVFYAITFVLQYLLIQNFPEFLLPGGYFIQGVGMFLFLFGFVLAIWAKFTMKSSWGMPAKLDIARQRELVTDGPFRFTRNPIYIAIFFFGFGYFLILRSPLIIIMILPLVYFIKAVAQEEALLEIRFGNEYLKYKNEVKRWF